MRIFFDTDELAALRDRAGHAGFDVAGIGAELAAAAGAVAVHELAAFRIGNAVRLASDVAGVSGDLGVVAARLEGDGVIAQAQITRAWWSQGTDAILYGLKQGKSAWDRSGLDDVLKDVRHLASGALTVASEAHWIGRVVSLAREGKLLESQKRWKIGGYYDRHLGHAYVGLVTGAGAVASLFGLKSIGKLSQLGGNMAESAYKFVQVAKLPAETTLKFAKLGPLLTAYDAYSVIGGADRKAWDEGNRSKNSADRTRANVTYAANITTVGGEALMMVPFPPAQLLGAGMVGVSAAAEGVAWLSSSANRAAVLHDAGNVGHAVGSGAKKAWHVLTPF